MTEDERREHSRLQKAYFDQRAHVFAQHIPEAVEERTARIVAAGDIDGDCRVLDVGTGLAVLFKHFLAAGARLDNIVGVDISESMVAGARQRYPQARFWRGDIVEFPDSHGRFDVVFINACFGNFFDQKQVLEHLGALLSGNGRIIISHPMGARFVAALREGEPEIVPHLLPDRERLESWAGELNLKLSLFVDEPDLYIARLEKAKPA